MYVDIKRNHTQIQEETNDYSMFVTVIDVTES